MENNQLAATTERLSAASKSKVYNFNYQWKFKLANAFPLADALEAWKDCNGRYFYEKEYVEEDWQAVGLPHTYNDKDLFVARIEDAGSGQLRTFSFYRKWFRLPDKYDGNKVMIEFEGIRQTCYLYINGKLAGYYEAGVAPFAFDLTPYIEYDQDNVIAVATDSTSSRNLDYFVAETPNLPDAEPGTFMTSFTELEQIPEAARGVGYFWNCNDFNPSVGGLTKNVRLHVKPKLYITLPIYSNLQTKGVYIYGSDYDIKQRQAVIHTEAEIRNETGLEQIAELLSVIYDHRGEEVGRMSSGQVEIAASCHLPEYPPLSVTPNDAYRKTGNGYVPSPEDEVEPTATESLEVALVKMDALISGLRFWSPDDPYLYTVRTNLLLDGEVLDTIETVTGFRKVSYDANQGLLINDTPVWLTGYAQRSSNEWAVIGIAPDWLRDLDAKLIRESNANHIRFMHVAACPADIRSCDHYGIVCTQPAGDKERENFGRQWDQRVEAMRDIIIYFRNHPSIIFWEAGNNSINKEHMREMRLLKEKLDPRGGRFMGCRTLSTEEVVAEAEYVGTMLNRHAGRFQSVKMPVTETEYLREESPRRVWDDYSPPDFDYDNLWLGLGGRKQVGGDCHDLTAEDFALYAAKAYAEFFHDRMGGASGKNLYSATAALCWTDSAQHGRQAASENARMSGRVDPVRIKKQSFDVFRIIQSPVPAVKIIGHWNYPAEDGENYRYAVKEFDGTHWRKTGAYRYRNPKDKTVYVVGSYAIAKVELYINDQLAATCDKPVDTFLFPFEHIDVTRSGSITAKAFDYNGNQVAADTIETASVPARLRLTAFTGDKGFSADGADIAYVDVEVVDEQGRLCPLAYDRIDFRIEGEGIFLGGYNSGRFNGYGKEDSVIHQMHVFAECGNNRVFIRSTAQAGVIRLTASMNGLPEACLTLYSQPVGASALALELPQRLLPPCSETLTRSSYPFQAIPQADAAKYAAPGSIYCKILVDGQEPDTRGIMSIYDHGSIYSPILFILERIKNDRPELFDYSYDAEAGILMLSSNKKCVIAEKGRTHLLVNGEENLLNGEPYIRPDGILIVEINAVISYIKGIVSYYDDNVHVFRIELPPSSV
ncbi:beta-galactosidase [Paenibacillus montaniterrae]|uniref:Beta-galactosidase n=1 Tax=Paenibacillus montaniterrae TaxID=429341 RepID=A0A919YT20_9BACL|nr:sugar-binding domain-containing protein [Paenibacillus montaniterrae]GIP16368.1 beta-galactosidase [Paenibacillus montaniterrae]